VVKHWKSCLTVFELGTSVRFNRRAIFCCSLSGSWVENSQKTAHSSVKHQICLPNALITALETVPLCHVSYNHLNHATTAAAGHCRERHHQKMSSVTFSRTIGHCAAQGLQFVNHVFVVAHLITERKHFCGV